MKKTHEIARLMGELHITFARASDGRAEINIDHAKYDALFDAEGIAPDQRRELLEALASIILAFVDLGFGVHPVQKAQDNNELDVEKCGQANPFSVDYEKLTKADNDDWDSDLPIPPSPEREES